MAGSVAYVGLFFLTRRAVALRVNRLGWLFVVYSILQTASFVDTASKGSLIAALVLTILLGTANVLAGKRIWLVRVGGEELREQLETVCRGLFLDCEEPSPGRFVLSPKREARHCLVRELDSNIQCLILPKPAGHRKVALVLDWLSKQYSGPIPRIHIVLKRREK